MSSKRMRVFAGPNGSGKTSIIDKLRGEFSFGVYVNADDIEHLLRKTSTLDFGTYKLQILQDILQEYFKASTFSPVKRKEADLWKKLSVINNVLQSDTEIDSYLAADLAEFIRQTLLANGMSFTYETVMSHEKKVDFMAEARQKGYRVYLYYIATENPLINISRVKLRIAQNGHGVSPEVITKRYFKSLQQLKKAVQNSDRAYIWDNSGKSSLLISKIENGVDGAIIDPLKVPGWFVKYLVEDSNE